MGRPKGSKNRVRKGWVGDVDYHKEKKKSIPRKHTPVELDGNLNIERFIELLHDRGDNPLYQMADEIQARSAFSAYAAIKRIKKIIDDENFGEAVVDESGVTKDPMIPELLKLSSSLNRNMTAVVQTFKSLGISDAVRQKETDMDRISRILAEIDVEKDLPPQLQQQYITATQDIERVSEGKLKIAEDGTCPDEMIKKVGEPVRSYTGAKEPEKGAKVIDMTTAKVRQLN